MRGLKLRSLKCLWPTANSWPTHEWMDVSWWQCCVGVCRCWFVCWPVCKFLATQQLDISLCKWREKPSVFKKLEKTDINLDTTRRLFGGDSIKVDTG